MLRPLTALLLLPAALAAQTQEEELLREFRTLPPAGDLAVGTSREGRLTSDDPRALREGPHVQVWTIRPAAGQTVTIDLLSDDFDAMLFLVGPGMSEPLFDDDGAGRCSSRITHTFDGAEYRLVVTSFIIAGPVTGVFTLRAGTDPPPPEEGSCDLLGDMGMGFEGGLGDVTIEALNALPSAGALGRGDSVQGTLDASAPELGGTGRRGVAYDVAGPPGGALTIDVASTDFDTYLYVVHGHHAEPLSDDDAGGACNSRLTLTLPESGRVRAVVSSFGGGAEGAYSLGVYRTPPPARQGSCGVTSRFDPAAVDAMPVAGRVAVGDAREGALQDDDAQLDLYHADIWEIAGVAGERVVIDLVSTEFDAYLGITGPGFVEDQTDDDSGGRCNSRLDVTFPETATYRVVATTFRNAATGRYTIRVGRTAGPAAEGSCSPARESDERLNALPLRGTLEMGVTDGRLSAGSPTLNGGSHADAWELTVGPEESYTVEMTSPDFDTFLYVVSPDGFVTDNDDCDGTDSRVVVHGDRRGRWRIVASSFVEAEGAYTLRLRRGAPDQPCGAALGWTDQGVNYDEAPIVGRLQLGDEYRGSLDAEDTRHYDGSAMEAFDLMGRAGEEATVDLVSEAFDAYLIVLGRGLPEMLTDDDGGGQCHARITLTFPESGTYRVVVNTLMSDQFGPYVLRVSAMAGPRAPGDCAIP